MDDIRDFWNDVADDWRAQVGVDGEGAAEEDVVGVGAVALDEEVGLADGERLRVHLLAEPIPAWVSPETPEIVR